MSRLSANGTDVGETYFIPSFAFYFQEEDDDRVFFIKNDSVATDEKERFYDIPFMRTLEGGEVKVMEEYRERIEEALEARGHEPIAKTAGFMRVRFV